MRIFEELEEIYGVEGVKEVVKTAKKQVEEGENAKEAIKELRKMLEIPETGEELTKFRKIKVKIREMQRASSALRQFSDSLKGYCGLPAEASHSEAVSSIQLVAVLTLSLKLFKSYTCRLELTRRREDRALIETDQWVLRGRAGGSLKMSLLP